MDIRGNSVIINSDIKLSVIVPVYMVEKYISKCLDSLLKQDLESTEYEIICVDDGSTDESGRICDGYASSHSQIRVIHRTHGGVSAARNTGLDQAVGKYVLFVDADDYLENNVLGRLYRIAEDNDLDKFLFNFQRFDDGADPETAESGIELSEPVVFENALVMDESEITPQWKISWNYLVKRELIERYGIRFVEGVVLYEDAEFNFWLNRCAGKCAYIDNTLYYYRKRAGSAVDSFMTDDNFTGFADGRLLLIKLKKRDISNFVDGNETITPFHTSRAELEDRYVNEIQGLLNSCRKKQNKELFEHYLAELKKSGDYPFPLLLRRLKRESVYGFVSNAASLFYMNECYLRCIYKITGMLRK